jgi:YidC/Oxa1 family membrane protein insertase
LPLLLQMPFLYALYAVLNLNVELRQAAFLNVWLTDLSVPDVIFSLPFKVPLFNVDQFSGLAVVMGITMFIQQKMSVTDPRQQAMLYMMPVMFTLIFSSLPSGLNLYYFVFNILSIGQQIYINNYSRLQKKMREAQEVAAQQQRPVQGKKRK